MASESPIVLIFARYDLSDDAKADLTTARQLCLDRLVRFYDAALIVTDAWDQVQIREWATPILGGGATGFLRRAVAALFGGVVGASTMTKAVPDAAYTGLPRTDLDRIGDSLAPDATAIVAAAQTSHGEEFAACFSRAARTMRREVASDPDGEYPGLTAALAEMTAAA